MTGNERTTIAAELGAYGHAPAGELPTLGQLRSRTRHLRNHIARNLEALDTEAGARAAIRRSRVLQFLAELEVTVAELHAHQAERGRETGP